MLFVETSVFTKHLTAHLDDDNYAALQVLLAVRPHAGPVIRGSGGVIYYWRAPEGRIYLLTLYSKGVRDDVTPAERAVWRRAVEEIEHE